MTGAIKMKSVDSLFNRPPPVLSGAPLDYKVKVQHRSDILMTEQIQTVKNVRDALERSLSQLEHAKTLDETKFHKRQVIDLKEKNDEMMLILKVVHKINAELTHARVELQKTLKANGNVNLARKRVGWLEDRMENLLGRKRQRSPARANMRSALMMDDPRSMMYDRDSLDSGRPLGMRPGEDFLTDTSITDTPRLPFYNAGGDNNRGPPGILSTSTYESNAMPAQDENESSPTNESASQFIQTPTSDIYSQQPRHQRTTSPNESLPSVDTHIALTAHMPSQDMDAQEQEEQIGQITVVTIKDRQESKENESEKSEEEGSDSSMSSSSSVGSDSESDEVKKQTFVTEVASTHTRESKGSRVTIKSPTAELEEVMNKGGEESPYEEYWQSEHHRFEHSEYAAMLCQLNPLSYHQMGIAVPGTFVKENDREPALPWRAKRKGSDVTDIHKLELDRLERRVHRMLDKVHDAAMLSVRHVPHDPLGTSILNQFDLDLTLKDKSKKNTAKPTMAKFVNMEKFGNQEVVTFPPLDKDRLGSSMSGRLIYYPNPLPYPDKLPITRTSRDVEYPRPSASFTEDVVGKGGPPDRFVNQRNLTKETKFTSSLYRSKPSRRSPTSSEKRFRRMLLGGSPSSEAAMKKPAPAQKLKATFRTAKTMMMLKGSDTFGAGSKWKTMKPKSGALDHSGLKWERVKSIVRESLSSENEEERIDSARLLGALKCGDTMVTYALKERLKNDSSDRVQYEAAKSLILLGCWEEEVLGRVVEFMLHGNSDIIANLLKTLINGKNVQYVDKGMPSFPDLAMILSELCLFDDVNDKISLDAAVALGKLCVSDDNAKSKLLQVLNDSSTHIKSQALEILVRQLNYRGWDMIEAVLYQLKQSPVWKYRKDAAKLLILIGKKHVCLNGKVEGVYELLDKQLWDDPNKHVRQEVARAMAALEMFARACEKAEKRLEDPSEDARAQAVISLGTLGMKNERILRVLLEMLELDNSEYVRLMIIRTLANLNTQDKRVLRVLKDKERGEGPLAREAKKALEILSKSGAPPNAGKNANGT